jgi:hypothetical protein
VFGAVESARGSARSAELKEQVQSLGREVEALRHRLRDKQDEVARLRAGKAGAPQAAPVSLPPVVPRPIDPTAPEDTLLGQLVGEGTGVRVKGGGDTGALTGFGPDPSTTASVACNWWYYPCD